jgi:hypothetical protein
MADTLPRIVIGTPQTVAYGPGFNAASPMLCLANGDIVVAVDRWEPGESRIAESFAMISSDGGQAWRKQPMPWAGAVKEQLRDGTLIATTGWAEGPPAQPGVYIYPGRRGKDTWESLQPDRITARVPAIAGVGDDLKSYYGVILWNRIIEMPGGDLLTTAYGYFEGDDEPIEFSYEPYRPKTYPHPGYNKTRVVLLKSTDQGRSWDYVTTVSYDPSSGEEGPCEPSLTLTQGGDLVCLMRTGRVNALRICRSRDGGQAWTPLEVVPGTIGVAPYLITMQDGTLACGYGMKEDYWRMEHRRELRVMFSFDEGRSWPLNEIVYAGEAGSYPSLREVAPGELMMAIESVAFAAPPGEALPVFVRVARIRLKQAPVYKWA